MRVKVVLDLKDKKISVKYNSILQGAIYYALLGNDKIDEIHNDGFKLGKRKFKLFTFSEIYGQSKYLPETKEILFLNNGHFYLASSNESLIMSFIDFLQQNLFIVLGKQIIEVIRFEVLDDFVTDSKIETYTTLSPITIYKTNEDKKTIYINPNDEEFKNSIISNLSKKFYLIYKENIHEIEITKIRIKTEKVVYFRNNFIIAYHLSITFSNLSDKVKKVILNTGLGSKNSSGFGMVQLLNEKNNLSV